MRKKDNVGSALQSQKKDSMLVDISNLLHELFATDQSYYAKQIPDGNYTKSPGLVTPERIKDCLVDADSMAVYQKNKDATIKWICFDFDVLKHHLGEDSYSEAREELNQAVKAFCTSLEKFAIPYLLEFSGNRGFHVWITLMEVVSHHIGYQIQQTILDSVDLKYNPNLVGIDLFPSSASPTDGVGKCVKLPLSKHKKSGKYSTILASLDNVGSIEVGATLTAQIQTEALSVLRSHKSIGRSEIEELLGVFFDLTHEESHHSERVKSVTIDRAFTLGELQAHWAKTEPLKQIGTSVFLEGKLSNSQRKLLVGMFCNICCEDRDFGNKILHEIFGLTSNYDSVKSRKAISALSSFYFPSQQQIEENGNAKFGETLSIENLIKYCVPNYVSHEQATFDISDKDIEITRRAELNYLFQNDEAQARLVADILATGDNQDFLERGNAILADPKTVQFYRHLRYEDGKTRTLVSLKAPERVITSCVLKQLLYFYGFEQNTNSHGYQANKGFAGGYIFKPWLYLWIQFISNISSALEDRNNREYYVVKTDIKSYYESIPHDSLKRLMLGGVNARIDAALKSLNETSRLKYNSLVDSLFGVTSVIMDGNKGLPQGPAYARYMAEIYLDNLDQKFEKRIQDSNIFLYQRYVDDIFFIAETKKIADSTLVDLEEDLRLLGLKINPNKTSVVKIKHFGEHFEQYRSQSKYAIDSVSKDFSAATDAQKDLAINEFINLIQSENYTDDLSFIFSHLPNVPSIDIMKRDKVVPALKSGLGRGSLYKHLFTFVLESSDNWELLYDVSEYNEIQSEVFTATVINILESTKIDRDKICNLIRELQPRLCRTELTDQHLVYMALRYGAALQLEQVSDNVFLECLASIPDAEHASMPEGLIGRLNTTLNDIKSLSEFVATLYPLCACLKTSKVELHGLAQTFYSKLAADQSRGELLSDVSISTNVTAAKFYYLLCLFSLSSANSSVELLKSMWEFCASTFNRLDYDFDKQRISNWFERLSDVEIDETKALLVISSIVDGNIYRGSIDRRRSFKYFHNIVLLFLTSDGKYEHADDIAKALESLRGISTFYDWIVDHEGVYMFPSTKSWFEENVIQNNCIILRKHDQLLLRRPISDLCSEPSSGVNDTEDGYVEVAIAYNKKDVVSLKEAVSHGNVVKSIGVLLDLIGCSPEGTAFPNIFSQEKMLVKDTFLPFNRELCESRALIFEDYTGQVYTRRNNLKEFVSLFFAMATDGQADDGVSLAEKYLRKLDSGIDLLTFIRHAYSQFLSYGSSIDVVLYDIGFATALFLTLDQMDPLVRVGKFVTQYHKFNSDDLDKHIYAIPEGMFVDDENPLRLLDTITVSLRSAKEVFPHIPFFLADDIALYRELLISCARDHGTGSVLDLDSFYKATHRISQVSEKITLNGIEFKFQDVFLINVTTGGLQRFESRYSVFLNSAEHVYHLGQGTTAYVIAVNTDISRIFRAIETRFELSVPHLTDYPPAVTNESEIQSLPQFEEAVSAVSVHRDIAREDASAILLCWLRGLPVKFHHSLVALIAAHALMNAPDRQNFIRTVRICLNNKNLNPFLIKDLGDFNGTQRILYTDSELGRRISACTPIEISPGANQATIIVDTVITGSQVIKALSFYLTGKGRNQNYFHFSKAKTKQVSQRLGSLRKLKICVVLYTDDAIEKISSWCKENINSSFVVELLCGRNIGPDALFGTSTKLGDQDKQKITSLLSDDILMRELLSHLNTLGKTPRSCYKDSLSQMNLVARYQSLPKKCFAFLHLGLRHGAPAPFERVAEVYEAKNN